MTRQEIGSWGGGVMEGGREQQLQKMRTFTSDAAVRVKTDKRVTTAANDDVKLPGLPCKLI